MHGFEDAFYRDGQTLVDTAYGVIASLQEQPAALGAVEVMIVPCANPDGLAEGWTCNGPGRCQISQGIDISLAYEDKEKTFYDGVFAGWAAKYAKSVLVEYPNPLTGQGPYEGKSDRKYNYTKSEFNQFGYAEKTAAAIREIGQKIIFK